MFSIKEKQFFTWEIKMYLKGVEIKSFNLSENKYQILRRNIRYKSLKIIRPEKNYSNSNNCY